MEQRDSSKVEGGKIFHRLNRGEKEQLLKKKRRRNKRTTENLGEKNQIRNRSSEQRKVVRVRNAR